MGLALLAFVVAQSPLKREIRVGLERKYRVTVVQEAGDRISYRLKTKVVDPAPKAKRVSRDAPKGPKTEPAAGSLVLELRLTDYRATLEGQNVSAPMIGGGQMPLDANGLPHGLNVTGTQGPVWLPFLALYFPEDGAEGGFTIVRTPVGTGLDVLGTGTLTTERGRRTLKLDARLASTEREFAKLTIVATIDGAGWPEKAEGTFVSDDGTYRFTLTKG